MKTATLFIVFTLGLIQYSFSKGCSKYISIGNNSWQSNYLTWEQTIARGDSLRITMDVWGGDCVNGSSECWRTGPGELYKDSVLISTSSSALFIVDTGNYYCTASFNSCGSTGHFNIWLHVKYSTVGINELNENSSFNVFPVPASNYISVPDRIKDLLFYDLTGKEISHIQFPDESVDISDLLSGYYLIVGTTNDDKRIFSKMIKE